MADFFARIHISKVSPSIPSSTVNSSKRNGCIVGDKETQFIEQIIMEAHSHASCREPGDFKPKTLRGINK